MPIDSLLFKASFRSSESVAQKITGHKNLPKKVTFQNFSHIIGFSEREIQSIPLIITVDLKQHQTFSSGTMEAQKISFGHLILACNVQHPSFTWIRITF